jgi:hypothetical protein
MIVGKYSTETEIEWCHDGVLAISGFVALLAMLIDDRKKSRFLT